MARKSYYEIALEDYTASKILYQSGLYNKSGISAYECIEKLLKYVINHYEISPVELLHSHNLKTLRNSIIDYFPDLDFTLEDIGIMTGLYFDLRYPSLDNYDIDKTKSEEIIDVMERVKKSVEVIIDYSNTSKE
ncbi:MAG: hypothetical protein K0R92_2558 [Lachnospiraceae bacterium]|jgi:HEPN domain-containing protein|nr:hypothetical protein [Lachnospiraceae bacterium]